ncbi:MAG: hypothetical protein ACKVIS_09515 [Pseudomonadales bacterium]
MPSKATELKYVRRILQENADHFLRISGMDFYHDQFFYKYSDQEIYFAEVGVSGAFRGEHWKSLSCTIHIYYRNFPGYGKPPLHELGNPIPTYRQSRLRFGQERVIDQSSIIETLNNSSLKYDRNFWHVLDDESNVKEVLEDMARVIRDTGLPLVQKSIYSREAMLEKEMAAKNRTK